MPILAGYGLSATIFVATHWAGSVDTFYGHTMASWSDLREWLAHGCVVGSQTVSHADLTRLPPPRALDELQA